MIATILSAARDDVAGEDPLCCNCSGQLADIAWPASVPISQHLGNHAGYTLPKRRNSTSPRAMVRARHVTIPRDLANNAHGHCQKAPALLLSGAGMVELSSLFSIGCIATLFASAFLPQKLVKSTLHSEAVFWPIRRVLPAIHHQPVSFRDGHKFCPPCEHRPIGRLL
jgi:hypothetical protein